MLVVPEASADRQELANRLHRQKAAEREIVSAQQAAWRALSPEKSRSKEEQGSKALPFEANALQNVAQSKQTFLNYRAQMAQAAGDVQTAEDELSMQRVAALLELNDSVKLSSIRQHRRLLQHKSTLKARKSALLREQATLRAQGLNPYEVFRKRLLDETNATTKAKQTAAIELQKQQITKRLNRERRLISRQKAQDKIHEAAVHKYQQEMGRAVAERRCNRFMLKHTTEHIPVVDPTGRLPVAPSKMTIAVDKSFGLGSAAPSALVLAEKRFLQAQIMQSLLPQRLRLPDADATKPTAAPIGPSDDTEKPAHATQDLDGIQAASWAFGTELRQVIVNGKSDFGASPSSVTFNDVEPGKKYTQAVILTNVSAAPAAFKVRNVSPSSCRWLNVQWKPAGSLVAGRSSKILIKASIPGDVGATGTDSLEEEVEVATPKGLLRIPIKCSFKTFTVEVEPKAIQFSHTVIGSQTTKFITIRNTGGIAAALKITGLDHEANPGPFSISHAPATLPGHSSASLQVQFRPTRLGRTQQRLTLQLAASSGSWDPITAIVELQGVGTPEPVSLKEDCIDLQCCVIGRPYNLQVTVSNSGSLASQASLSFPSWLGAQMTCPSKYALCLAGQSHAFHLTFKPNEDLLKRQDQQEGTSPNFKIPCKVTVQGQKAQLSFDIICRLTTPSFLVTPSQLTFGDALLHEQTGLDLTITNNSLLPQDVGFLNLPASVKMTPEDGLCHVLPNEARSLKVWYKPQSGDQQKPFHLLCRGSLGGQQRIACSARVIRSPLVLSCSEVMMPATIPGGTSEARLTISNTSKLSQRFHLMGLANTSLQICPVVSELSPGQSQILTIRHAALLSLLPQQPEVAAAPTATQPPSTAKATKPGAAAAAAAGAAAAAASKSVGKSTPGQPKQAATSESSGTKQPKEAKADAAVSDSSSSRPATASAQAPSPAADSAAGGETTSALLAEVKPSTLQGQGPRALLQEQHIVTCHVRPQPGSKEAAIAMTLAVSTTTIEPGWTLTGDARPEPSLNCYVLDFGSVPLDSKSVKSTSLENTSVAPIRMATKPLDPFGPFRLERALRTAPPAAASQIDLAFLPQVMGSFAETVTLCLDGHTLRILMKGEGAEKPPETKVPDKAKKPGTAAERKK